MYAFCLSRPDIKDSRLGNAFQLADCEHMLYNKEYYSFHNRYIVSIYCENGMCLCVCVVGVAVVVQRGKTKDRGGFSGFSQAPKVRCSA